MLETMQLKELFIFNDWQPKDSGLIKRNRLGTRTARADIFVIKPKNLTLTPNFKP